jgi:O-antigen ligase
LPLKELFVFLKGIWHSESNQSYPVKRMRFRNTSLPRATDKAVLATPFQSPAPVAVAVPAAPVPARRNAELAIATKFNLVMLTTSLLLFSHFGRLFEKILVGYKLPAIICSIGILAALVSGAVRRLDTRIGIASCALVAWMALSTPFSTWRGGSANYLLWYVAFWVVLLVLVAHAPRNVRDIARLGYVTAFSCLFFLVSGIREESGRLSSTGTFGNSDDVALLAGYCIPFAILLAQQIRNPVFRYLVMFGSAGYLLTSVGRTAARAGLLALAGMAFLYFLRSSGMQRVWIAGACVVSLGAMLVILPQSALDRFSTIVDSLDVVQGGPGGYTEAMASTAERRDLLMDAIQMTKDNPIFGVGAGEFPDYRYRHLRYKSGSPKRYFPSHNTYAQISAENGIPGLLLYVVFLFMIYKTIRKTRVLAAQAADHPQIKLIYQVCTCLEAALIYFSICAFFMTCDRHPHQFVIAGLAIALERLLQFWISQSATPPQDISSRLQGQSNSRQKPVRTGPLQPDLAFPRRFSF